MAVTAPASRRRGGDRRGPRRVELAGVGLGSGDRGCCGDQVAARGVGRDRHVVARAGRSLGIGEAGEVRAGGVVRVGDAPGRHRRVGARDRGVGLAARSVGRAGEGHGDRAGDGAIGERHTGWRVQLDSRERRATGGRRGGEVAARGVGCDRHVVAGARGEPGELGAGGVARLGHARRRHRCIGAGRRRVGLAARCVRRAREGDREGARRRRRRGDGRDRRCRELDRRERGRRRHARQRQGEASRRHGGELDEVGRAGSEPRQLGARGVARLGDAPGRHRCVGAGLRGVARGGDTARCGERGGDGTRGRRRGSDRRGARCADLAGGCLRARDARRGRGEVARRGVGRDRHVVARAGRALRVGETGEVRAGGVVRVGDAPGRHRRVGAGRRGVGLAARGVRRARVGDRDRARDRAVVEGQPRRRGELGGREGGARRGGRRALHVARRRVRSDRDPVASARCEPGHLGPRGVARRRDAARRHRRVRAGVGGVARRCGARRRCERGGDRPRRRRRRRDDRGAWGCDLAGVSVRAGDR